MVEQRSPKPRAEGSSPSAPAKQKALKQRVFKAFAVLFIARCTVDFFRFDAQIWASISYPVVTVCNISVCYIIKIASIFDWNHLFLNLPYTFLCILLSISTNIYRYACMNSPINQTLSKICYKYQHTFHNRSNFPA